MENKVRETKSVNKIYCELWNYLVVLFIVIPGISVLAGHLFYLSEGLTRTRFSAYKEIKEHINSGKIIVGKSMIYARISVISWLVYRVYLVLLFVYIIILSCFCE